MSHYCSYNLCVKGITPMKQPALEAALMTFGMFDLEVYVDEKNNTIEYATDDVVIWDNEESDMIALSKLFPDATFRLESYDADCCERSLTYYKNGESEYCPYVPVIPKNIIW